MLPALLAASLLTGAAPDRVLFVGNSLTAGNDLPLLVEALSIAGGRPLAVEAVTHGGVSLEDHWGRKTQDRIAGSTWKYVVLQQGPSSLEEGRASLREWTRRFDGVIRRSGGTTALFMVWPESRRHSAFPMVAESYRLAARDVGGVLLPAGEAWLAAWRRRPSLALYGPDGFHPSPAGSYLAALAIYARLTGASPVGLPGQLRLRNGAACSIDADELVVLQAAAAEAIGGAADAVQNRPPLRYDLRPIRKGQGGVMTSITEAPESKPSSGEGGGKTLAMVSTGLAVVALGLAAFLFVELRGARTQIAALTEQADGAEKRARELDLSLAALRGQTVTIAERTGITETELEKTAAAARELREAQRKGQANLASLGGEVGKVKEDVAASRAALEQAQAQLQTAIGDLGQHSGLIARNADELAALKRAGSREYFEFDLAKAKKPAPVGPVAVRLKDADAKKHKFNLVLVVDDVEIEKKDKTLLEPVQFYRKGSRQLNEIVVFGVQKDRITGYLSTPKTADATASN